MSDVVDAAAFGCGWALFQVVPLDERVHGLGESVVQVDV